MNVTALSELVEIYLQRAGVPIPVFKEDMYGWYYKHGFKFGEGKHLFYTGLLYQMSPYIENLVLLMHIVEKKDRSALGNLVRLASIFYEPTYHILRIIIRPQKKEIERINKIIVNILFSLIKSGIDIHYNPAYDKYSGILLNDIGNINAFIDNAHRIHQILKETGRKKIVTIDPHTTYALSVLFPKYIDNYDFEVIPYFELLDTKVVSEKRFNELVIHDSCIYAREFGLEENIRKILSKATLRLVEPMMSGKNTNCCGGPIEFFMPSLASKIAEKRINELASYSKNIVVSCPICLYNFKRNIKDSSINVIDMGEVI